VCVAFPLSQYARSELTRFQSSHKAEIPQARSLHRAYCQPRSREKALRTEHDRTRRNGRSELANPRRGPDAASPRESFRDTPDNIFHHKFHQVIRDWGVGGRRYDSHQSREHPQRTPVVYSPLHRWQGPCAQCLSGGHDGTLPHCKFTSRPSCAPTAPRSSLQQQTNRTERESRRFNPHRPRRAKSPRSADVGLGGPRSR